MDSKKCSKCDKVKLISEFNKRKERINGYQSACKVCQSKKSKEFQKTKSGVISRIYSNQKVHSKRRNHVMPNYTRNELRDFIFSCSDWKSIYGNWVKSKYKKDLSPSIDRINDYRPYTLDNIQLTTWQKNRDKSYIDKINGKNNKNNKAVLKYDINDGYICEYYSMSEAGRQHNISSGEISLAVKKSVIRGGFKWKLK